MLAHFTATIPLIRFGSGVQRAFLVLKKLQLSTVSRVRCGVSKTTVVQTATLQQSSTHLIVEVGSSSSGMLCQIYAENSLALVAS